MSGELLIFHFSRLHELIVVMVLVFRTLASGLVNGVLGVESLLSLVLPHESTFLSGMLVWYAECGSRF